MGQCSEVIKETESILYFRDVKELHCSIALSNTLNTLEMMQMQTANLDLLGVCVRVCVCFSKLESIRPQNSLFLGMMSVLSNSAKAMCVFMSV